MSDLEEKLSKLSVEEDKKPEIQDASDQETKVGLVYDPRMKDHCNEVDPWHPEKPERISRIWEALVDGRYTNRCNIIQSRDATEQEIELVHKEVHFKLMQTTPKLSPDKLVSLSLNYNSVFLNQASFPCALLSAGCVIEMTEQVVSGKLKNGIAVVRPPGHHAEAGFCMGFCVFNNVAVAAKVAIEKHGLQRVMIVDWDVHHGNATQHMFYNDKRVLYVSLHRYDNGMFYPGNPDASHTHVGKEEGEGYNINVAWSGSTMGDAEYLAAFHHILMPIAYEYNPELVIISCGFDAARGDPLGHYDITPSGYAHMTHLLTSLAGGKVIIALEGGYNLTSISNSMCACAAALLGDVLPPVESAVPNYYAVECIRNVAQVHAKYWKSLKVIETNYPTVGEALGEREGHWQDDSEDVMDRVTPEEEHTSFGRSGPQIRPEDAVPQVTTSEVSVDREATPTTQSRDKGATPPDQAGITESQQEVVESLQDAGNVVMFAVVPKPWCEHLSQVNPLPPFGIDASQCCEMCGVRKEPWVCLTCYHVYCGRYINQHMLHHEETSGHKVVLSLADFSVWCFVCDSYMNNEVLMPAKNAAHRSKFGCNVEGWT